MTKLKRYCEDKRCAYRKEYSEQTLERRSYFLHSTQYYYPELYEETGEEYYTACENCVAEDHLKWASGEVDPTHSYRLRHSLNSKDYAKPKKEDI